MRIEKLRQQYQVDVKWRHFPLHPETPPQGQTLQALFAGRNVDLEASQARMRGLMQQEGLPYGSRTHTYNSRLAQELGAWADTQDDGEILHQALFQAYFVNGENIGEIETLVKIVEDVGLDPDEARDVLEARRLQTVVDADWSRAHALGITGVPTFVANGHGVVGAQPYDVLERLLAVAGASKRQVSE